MPVNVCLQRPPADADINAVRLLLVADEQLDLVGCLAPHGAHQGQPFRWHVGRFIGIKDTVSLGPLFGRQIQHTDADNLFGAGIEEREFPLGVGDHHAVADAAENGLHEAGLFLLPGERPFQLGFRLLEPGDVTGDDHAPFNNTCFSYQGSTAYVDMNAVRILLVAYEQLDVVRGLAVYGKPQRVPMLPNGRLSIGLKNTVFVSPFMDVSLQLTGSDHLLRIRVEDHGHAVPTDGEHGLAHAVEYGLHKLDEIFQFVNGSVQPDPRFSMPAFPPVPGDGGLNVQVQLHHFERPQHVAERVGRPRPSQQVRIGIVGQVNHGNLEPAADPLPRFRAREFPFQPEVNQGQVGSRGLGTFHGPAAAGNRDAHRISQGFQAFFDVSGAGFIVVDDQYLRVGQPVRVLSGRPTGADVSVPAGPRESTTTRRAGGGDGNTNVGVFLE